MKNITFLVGVIRLHFIHHFRLVSHGNIQVDSNWLFMCCVLFTL